MSVTVIRQKVLIPSATPGQVYRAFLSSKEHSEITGAKAACSAKEGAKFTAWDGYILGKNVALTKGKKIVQEWQTTEWPEDYGPSLLEISLKKSGKDTELSLAQTKIPASQAKDYDKGWHDFYWNPMKEYFASNDKK